MRKLAIAGVASVSAVLILLLVTPFLIPGDFLKDNIVTLIREKTGCDLRIAGPLHLRLFPHLGFVLTDVSLPSPTQDFRSDLLQARSVDVLVEFLPLVRGRIQIDRIELMRPAFHFEIDKQGRRNWVFARPQQPQPAITSSPGGARFTVAIADLTILRGTADYLDQRNGTRRLVTDLDLKFSRPERPLPAAAKGEAIWNGKKVTVAVTATSPEKLWEGETSPVTVHIVSAPVGADFAGDVKGGPHPEMIGAIHVDAPSMRSFVDWIGLRFPMHGNGFGHFVLRGKIDAARSRLHLTDTAIALDSSTARGALSLERRDPRPVLSGHLEIAALDLSPYFKREPAEAPTRPDSPPIPTISDTGAGEAAAQPPREARPPRWNTTPIDLKPLQLADADLSLRANVIGFRNIELGNTALALYFQHGRLVLNLTALNLYRGTGSGKIVADSTGKTLAVAASLDLHGIEAGPLFAGAAGFNQLAGRGDVSIAVSGEGDNDKEIVSSLNGTCRIDLTNGRLSGPALINLSRNIAGPFAYSRPKDIAFQSLSGSGTINHGILYNSDLKITSPKMSVSGSGIVDLISRRLDYLWVQQLRKLGNAQILITGPWSMPTYKVKSVSIDGGLLVSPGKTDGDFAK
ncbi:MAG: AsmA family protein [Alphaproteobacteria bacterium]|nr:AsmA family protein [Alphaproteobacteria bacterium]